MPATRPALQMMMLVSLLLTGAIFGFFYAWVCSTMWGLDATDPRIAIAAMQAMNGSVRNIVFFPAFFLTPAFLGMTALLLYFERYTKAALMFALAALVYLTCGLLLTSFINVPMNEALATVTIPDDMDEAARIWRDYSAPWQFWNTTRTIASGISLLLVGLGFLAMPNRNAAAH